MKIPFFDLRITNATIRRELLFSINKVLNHGKFFLGPEVKNLEKKIAIKIGAKYAVCVDSGSSALYLALKSAGIGKGDEVITTPLTWIITVNAIKSCGARPVFADVRGDFNIDPNSINNLITKKTKAIVPMHYGGHMCDMSNICKIAKKNDLLIIEDAAQAFGGSINGKKAGSFSVAASFSMNPMKVFGGCGEAGVVITNKKKIFNKLKILRHAGTTSNTKKITNNCIQVSLNHKMDTINAALLLVSLKKFNEKYKILKKIANRYDKELPFEVKKQSVFPGEVHARYAYPIRTNCREKLMKFLNKNGIETRIFHEPLACDAPIYKNLKKKKVPFARRVLKESLIIPLNDKLKKKDVDFIILTIKSFFKKKYKTLK